MPFLNELNVTKQILLHYILTTWIPHKGLITSATASQQVGSSSGCGLECRDLQTG